MILLVKSIIVINMFHLDNTLEETLKETHRETHTMRSDAVMMIMKPGGDPDRSREKLRKAFHPIGAPRFDHKLLRFYVFTSTFQEIL